MRNLVILIALISLCGCYDISERHKGEASLVDWTPIDEVLGKPQEPTEINYSAFRAYDPKSRDKWDAMGSEKILDPVLFGKNYQLMKKEEILQLLGKPHYILEDGAFYYQILYGGSLSAMKLIFNENAVVAKQLLMIGE